MNTTISFELAQILKEKGFVFRQNETYYNPVNGFTKYEEITPTIAAVVMWLYEKHGIWISVFSTDDVTMFSYKLSYKFGHHYSQNFNSPTKAYEAAIEHTLKNII